ncbi:28277_t:CDS:2, partial [Racocetra persica]
SVSPDNNEKYEYGRPSSQESGPTKIQHVQEQIDSTQSEIHKSLFDMANRGKKLGDLEEQTAMLQETSNVFKLRSKQTRAKMWWKDTKWTIILVIFDKYPHTEQNFLGGYLDGPATAVRYVAKMWSPKLLNRLPAGKYRLSLIDKQMAVSAAKAINIPNNATVIEINSGLGFLTHALLNNTNAKRIIALDNDKDCVENLARLAEESSGRLEVIQAENNIVSKFASNKLEAICTWLQKEKLADMQIYPWEEVHPSFVSIFHLPDRMSGDYLLNQIMQDFYNRSGFQAYGRVRTNVFLPAYLYE